MNDYRPRLAPTLGLLLVLGFSAAVLGHVGGHEVVVQVDDLVTLAAAAAATAAAVLKSRRVARPHRRAWVLLAAGFGSWAIGEAVWAAYELGPRGSVPFPSPADAGYLLAVPLVAAGLLCLRRGGPATERLGALLDGVIVASSLVLVSWVTVLGPVFRHGTGSAFSQAISLAYPAGDIVIATLVVSALTRNRRLRGNPLVLLGAGLLAMAVSDSVYAGLTQAGTYRTGNPVDIGWVVAYVLIGLAALAPDAGAPEATDSTEPSLAFAVLPHVVVGLAFGVILLAIVADRAEDSAFEACAAVLCALVIGRQVLTLVDNRRLHARLRDKVAELGARERELERLAFRDPLTGLANRTAFLERVRGAVAARAAAPAPLSVLFLDLDDFKAVNDTLGHAAGDELLAEAASRLRPPVGGMALAARLGGDEFGILVEGPDPGPPTALAERIHDAFRSPFVVAERQMVVRASIGIAHSETGQVPGPELLRQADIAMYAAKRRGKGSSQVFGPDLTDGATERVLLRSALASALSSDALELHYQPIVELVSGRVWGVEALSRWTDGERGAVPPAEFIPLSEETGLIHDLGRWVLKRACAEAVTWPGGPGAPVLSVNVSATQLQDAAIVGTVSDALAASGLPAERLMVEVSESLLIAQGEPFHTRLATLRELGVRVAIDNFGTGYSSLRHLPRFPVDVIKIDQSLIRGIDDGASGLAVLRAIVELADQLGLDTVAEGVEEIRQADALASVGCRSGQGYWYRRPVPAASLWPLPTGSVLRPKPVSVERATLPRS